MGIHIASTTSITLLHTGGTAVAAIHISYQKSTK